MSIFAKTGDVVERLKDRNECLQQENEDLLFKNVDLRKEKADEIAYATRSLNSEISNLKSALDLHKNLLNEANKSVENDHSEFRTSLENEYESRISDHENRLDKEYKAKFTAFEADLKKSNGQTQEFKGLYEGALIIVKALEKQLEGNNKLFAQFFANLPTVDVKMKSPDSVSQIVNTNGGK